MRSLREIPAMAALRGDEQPFIVYGDRRIGFATFVDDANAVSNGLAELGVGHGDRVAVLAQNCPEWCLTFWGSVDIGGDPRRAQRVVEVRRDRLRPPGQRRQGARRRPQAHRPRHRRPRRVPRPRARAAHRLRPCRRRPRRRRPGPALRRRARRRPGRRGGSPSPRRTTRSTRTTPPSSSTPAAPPAGPRARSAPTAT